MDLCGLFILYAADLMVPGPEMFYMLMVGMRCRRMAIGSAFGIAFSAMIYKVLAVFGFLKWAIHNPGVLSTVRFCAGCFFFVVAVFMLHQAFSTKQGQASNVMQKFLAKSSFWRGFFSAHVVSLLNPLHIVGTISLFAVMLDVELSTSYLLVVCFFLSLMSFLWTLFLAIAAQHCASLINSKKVKVALPLLASIVFFYYAAKVLLEFV